MDSTHIILLYMLTLSILARIGIYLSDKKSKKNCCGKKRCPVVKRENDTTR